MFTTPRPDTTASPSRSYRARRGLAVLGAMAALALLPSCTSSSAASSPDVTGTPSSSPNPTSTAAVYACSLLTWADFVPHLGVDDASTRTAESVTSAAYPTACQWVARAAGEDGRPASIRVIVGFDPAATRSTTPLPAGAHWDTFMGHERTVEKSSLGSGEPTCQTGLIVPEFPGRVDMVVINAGARLMDVCTLADALNARILERVT